MNTDALQTVVETPAFQRSAAKAGMTENDIIQLVDFLAANPDAGDEIKETGGCRKLRVAGRGKGKSGGYRVITFYSGTAIPVFLLQAYSKADKSDLNAAERRDLRKLTGAIVETYRKPRRIRSVT
jgi:hypothetical protein